MYKIILVFMFIISSIQSWPNYAEKTDSLTIVSNDQTEVAVLLQEQLVDSLVKIKIQKELHLASGNKRRIKELEQRLNEIETEDSLRNVSIKLKIEELKMNSVNYPIAPFSDTLFYVSTKIASYTPQIRASHIVDRIRKMTNDPYFKTDSLKLFKTESGTEIVYNNELIVMVVTETDAMIAGKDDYELASDYLHLIKANISGELKTNTPSEWATRIALVIAIILILTLLIHFINKFYKWIDRGITNDNYKFKKGLIVYKIRIFSPQQLERFILKFSHLLRMITKLLTVYFSLPILFSIFPETKLWTRTLVNWIVTPAYKAFEGVINYLPNLFSILVIVFIFKYFIRGIKYFVDQMESGEIKIEGFHEEWAQPTFRILKFLLYAFMLVLIFPFLPGSGSPAFQGISVFIGVLFSLGSSSAIANTVAGMVITYMRPFKIGDRVKIGEITGDVIEKTMLVTRIKTPKNEDITVPNSTILLSSTTNYSTHTRLDGTGLIVHTTVTIGYDVSWKDVYQILLNAAEKTELVEKTPVPFVLQTSLDDFYVSYQINCYTREANSLAMVYSLLHQNIQDSFNEAGIEILSPHYRNHRDGNQTTIPKEYLDKDNKAPTFNIRSEK